MTNTHIPGWMSSVPVLAFSMYLGEITEAGQVRQSLSEKGALCFLSVRYHYTELGILIFEYVSVMKMFEEAAAVRALHDRYSRQLTTVAHHTSCSAPER